MIRTVVFSSDLIFNDGFKKFLQSQKSIKLVETSSNGNDVIRSFSKYDPDLIILDADLCGFNALFTIRELLQVSDSVKILLTTTGVSKMALKFLSGLTNLIILYKPFDSKMFLEKLDKFQF